VRRPFFISFRFFLVRGVMPARRQGLISSLVISPRSFASWSTANQQPILFPAEPDAAGIISQESRFSPIEKTLHAGNPPSRDRSVTNPPPTLDRSPARTFYDPAILGISVHLNSRAPPRAFSSASQTTANLFIPPSLHAPLIWRQAP